MTNCSSQTAYFTHIPQLYIVFKKFVTAFNLYTTGNSYPALGDTRSINNYLKYWNILGVVNICSMNKKTEVL